MMRFSLLPIIAGFIFLWLMVFALYTKGFEPAVLFGITAVFEMGLGIYWRIGEK